MCVCVLMFLLVQMMFPDLVDLVLFASFGTPCFHSSLAFQPRTFLHGTAGAPEGRAFGPRV